MRLILAAVERSKQVRQPAGRCRTEAQNTLIIICEESYTELSYPKERFEEYRSVINAAADFNKKTILLSKN